MKVELDKKGLMFLVSGIRPHSKETDHWKIKSRGHIEDGGWRWNFDIIKNLDELELWDLYSFCRQSWEEDIKK